MGKDFTRGGQFALIPARVLYDDQLPATAKLLYGEIYRLSYANGYCYASNRDFMDICLCSEATVSRLIGKLAEQNHIRVRMIRRNGETGDIVQRRIFCGQELAKNDPPEDPVGILKNEDTSPQNCGDGILKNEDTSLYKNINNNIPPIVPHGISQKEITERLENYAPGDPDLQEAVQGLLENRIVANKKPVKTMRSLNGLLNKLDRLSKGRRSAKLLMLENAVTNNWQTVYELKADELARLREEEARVEVDPDVVW